MKTAFRRPTEAELFRAGRTPQLLDFPAAVFLAIDGKGAPGGEPFGQAMQKLFAAAYTLKFALKSAGRGDFKVGRVECLYLSDPTTPMERWKWRILLRVSEHVGVRDLAAARKTILQKKGMDIAGVRRVRWREGHVVRALHVGPYDQVRAVYEQLCNFAAAHGLKATGPAHEIYLSDPRRTPPARLKTIVQLGVKRR